MDILVNDRKFICTTNEKDKRYEDGTNKTEVLSQFISGSCVPNALC